MQHYVKIWNEYASIVSISSSFPVVFVSRSLGLSSLSRGLPRSHALPCEADLSKGYACDPTNKSDTPIVAKPGLLVRLTRNFDKQRGFVNGALAVVRQVLKGNAVFIVELVGEHRRAGTLFLEEDGCRLLPCCYGYGTTIRRAQGAPLVQGCL